MKRFSFETTTHSAEETRAFGERLGRHITTGTTIALTGDLGSGKTVFVQGIARGLHVPPEYYITSPTFTLINEYPGRLRLHHIDLYRIEDPIEIEEIGVYEILGSNKVAVIEWAERLGAELPGQHIRVHLEMSNDNARHMTITATGSAAVALLKNAVTVNEDEKWG
ncbi:MAG: tRNA (adenosine(37)-N6)-threonylcarbamoyltransferase complex ATPase subunit type 1 TsaE [Desulfobacterales bacterium]|jgi:tRNA threonylcarbamoyladenosine biosynthesis protein TsaE